MARYFRTFGETLKDTVKSLIIPDREYAVGTALADSLSDTYLKQAMCMDLVFRKDLDFGETVAGRGNDAWSHYTKILPSYVEEKYQTLHKVEPYVNCQMVAGKDAAKPGEGKNSWLTGTAAWMWYTVSEFILGIKPDYEGLLIDPCLPSTAKEYEVTRKFRGGEYHITVKNPSGNQKGVKQITVDGTPISGTIVPCSEGKHEVVVEM
jgi:cellobiose phosphorylase